MEPSTTHPHSSLPLLIALVILAAILFTIGITWGLPTSARDKYLFGNHPRWTGAEILALAPGWTDDPARGADVAAHPLLDRSQPILLNATDADRAALVRRYRLYSDQPDEMITLRALAQMKPRKLQFDPRLYQYGGLWIYPVGGLLKIAGVKSDLAFYLDHPDAFGRLYVVMRLYSVLWGLVGVGVMFTLTRRITGSQLIAATAAIGYTLLPTVINAAHEAKPHLAGAVLTLIAVDMALRAMSSHKRVWPIAAGIACGASASMVLSGWLSIAILPVMIVCTPRRRITSFAMACAAAPLTYAIFNPYVIVHLFGDHGALRSNLENSAAMYQTPASIEGVLHGLGLLFDSGSIVVFFGLIALFVLAVRRRGISWLLLAATMPGLCIFLMHATGKAGEYARFALPADLLLMIGAVLGIDRLTNERQRLAACVILCLALLPLGASYVWHYGRETLDQSTRLIVAARLGELLPAPGGTLAVDAEPAPYTLPPVDLFRWKILLPARSQLHVDCDVRVDAVDEVLPANGNVRYWIRPRLLSTPISWAAKPFRVETPNAAPAAPVLK